MVALSGDARAQEAAVPLPVSANTPKDAQLFLEADTVTYDSDSGVVSASGGVQIDYGTNKLVAQKVVYNQKTRRLIASGDVALQQPDGTKVYGDTIDITDDFADGFVKALRIETNANTRFAAARAIRENGNKTSFEQGVYTACKACAEHPERAPLWQVKARKIVWDQTEKEVRYYGARFEFFGAPIAYLPYFQSPDPTVKRKSGFLPPSFFSSEQLGYGVRVPYFIALGEDKDVTVSGTYYSKQGFLGEAEYRQAFTDGIFTLKAAGISQQDPDAFADDNRPDYDSPDFSHTNRGMIGTTGRFALSDRWTFGWDVLAQTDDNFSNTYDIEGFGSTLHTSEIYLTGLGDQSLFDLRAQKFDYQTTNPYKSDQQPIVAPSFDYERIEQEPVLGGEVKFNANVTSLYRNDESDPVRVCEEAATTFDSSGKAACNTYRTDLLRYGGLEGDYTRGSTNAEWRDEYTLPSGLVLKPTLALRGDLYTADMASDGYRDQYGQIDVNNDGARGMATAALEARYPYLFETEHTTHIVEPIGQLIVRPDETSIGELPNEDAQTLVFNTGNLFELDKFSGYDRIEGGSRANVGVRYSGTIDSGYSIDAVIGQSYQLAGLNSYSQTDLALVGYDSGLETTRSDYVSSVSLATPIGVTLGTQERFDEETLDLRRADVYGAYSNKNGSAQLTYTNIAAQPTYASLGDRSQVTLSGAVKVATNWTAFGAVGYDIGNSQVIEKKLGAGYADECFSLIVSYSDTYDRYTGEPDSTKLMFKVGLRTISDFNQSFDVGG